MEVKYGYQSLTQTIRTQISKDAWLLANHRDVIRVEWHFFVSQHTGRGGPTQQLLDELLQRGFNVFFH